VVCPDVSVPAQAVEKPNGQKGQRVHAREARVENKQQEILVVADSHAIVHPGTVVCLPILLYRAVQCV
jgi:hypothetical protein